MLEVEFVDSMVDKRARRVRGRGPGSPKHKEVAEMDSLPLCSSGPVLCNRMVSSNAQ